MKLLVVGFTCAILPADPAIAATGQTGAGAGGRYNVVTILIDDHAYQLTSAFNPKSPVKTPNIERLAKRGTWFSHAYADAPVCSASRTAMLTGVHSANSGVYYNSHAYRRTKAPISRVTTLPGHFLNRGYLTAGYGKIAHNRFLEDDIGDYSPGYYKMFNRPADVRYTEGQLMAQILPGTRREVVGDRTAGWSFGILPDDWDRDDPEKQQQDTQQASRAVAFLGKQHAGSFFLTVGFYRPHTRWFAPKRFYDLFPLDSIRIPEGYLAGDLDDVPKPARWLATHLGEHRAIVEAGAWKEFLQGYYASIAYVDEQIGRVIQALDNSSYKDNTIVVFASDNGYHLGEKDHWTKFTLWEQACRVLFAIAVPGRAPRVSATPVGLIDIYPTLVSLCELPAPGHQLDGKDLSGIIDGRTAVRGGPVLSTYGRGNHSIRDHRFRYIRYQNGDEELYDHDADPYEWVNLVPTGRFDDARRRLAAHLPAVDAPAIEGGPERTEWSEEAFR